MSHRLTAAIKKDDKDVPIVKVKPGVFALREWEGKRGRRGSTAPVAESEDTTEEAAGADDSSGLEVNALEIEAALRGAEVGRSAEDEDGEDAGADEGEASGATTDRETPVTGADALRADLAASGAELFDDEEDDDQPILAPLSQPSSEASPQTGEGGRRRRRRRRRGRGGGQGEGANQGGDRFSGPRVGEARFSQAGPAGDRYSPAGEGQARADGAIQPAPIVSIEGEAGAEGFSPRPIVRDRQQIMAGGQPTGIDIPLGEGDELAGRELADAAAIVMASFDRNAGPVPLRSVGEALQRRGRLQGDPVLAAAQVSAAMRADNLRRTASGQRVRFRFASGGRAGLTDWALGGELPRLEQEVVAAVERYREASRRAMLRKLQELPGHALIELVLVALERAGMTNLRAVRRAGSPGGEAHFAAVHKTGSDSVPTAIVVRKDGRELGRERVTDLRGALHHYGPATAGWLVTTGQCLSGAREEAAATGAPPVALYDGIALCKLLEDIDVGVVKTRFAIAIPDLELLETLRG
jgi:hypothetical protein